VAGDPLEAWPGYFLDKLVPGLAKPPSKIEFQPLVQLRTTGGMALL
jgi:hypothetical protein